ncbi:MAG: HD domain-containing protein [Christensenellaceae bacterium]|nr:HD domain-containing protein [Christensenellaceae bacterium]
MDEKDYRYFVMSKQIARNASQRLAQPYEWYIDGKWVSKPKWDLDLEDARHDYGSFRVDEQEEITWKEAKAFISRHEDDPDLILHRAIQYATIQHKDQIRKGTQTPYISHIMEVAKILSSAGCDYKTIVAGILHDTIEDTTATQNDIEKLFGKEIADMVKGESEDKSKSWQERKQATIDRLKTASMPIKQIACADKLSNIISIYYDWLDCGEYVWTRFNASKRELQWYYDGVIKSLDMGEFSPYQKLKKYYNLVFNG